LKSTEEKSPLEKNNLQQECKVVKPVLAGFGCSCGEIYSVNIASDQSLEYRVKILVIWTKNFLCLP
jgi:hypothetical protein